MHRCDRNGAIRTMALVQFALCAVIGRMPTEGSNPRVRVCDEKADMGASGLLPCKLTPEVAAR